MDKRLLLATFFLCFSSPFVSTSAQVGDPFIHDPSTIAYCEGKYYTFGTGGGGLISEDGYTWKGGAERPGGGAAPDVLKIGDRYLLVYGATGGGLFGGHNGTILTMWNKTLDPKSPDFKFSNPTIVAHSDGNEDCDAIDPSLLLDPTTGRLWCTYGTYFGSIRLVELDPATGARKGGDPIDIAIDCEATDLICRDGWYYLLGTHGTCCDGVNSTYNIVVGRSRQVTGPYMDNVGRDMLKGGGRMVIAAHGDVVGPGHFGRYVEEEGVEKMSCHFEGDFTHDGMSVLGIRPLLWRDGWPVAGNAFSEGIYEIESVRRGYALELAVDFVRIPQERRMWTQQQDASQKPKPVLHQTLSDVSATWPKGDVSVRCSDFMVRPHQLWSITAVDGVGGYLGQPYYRIEVAGTHRALTATADGEVMGAEYVGDPTQLWRIDQLTDGTFRIMPKAVPNTTQRLALVSLGDSTPTLDKFDFSSDNSKWNLKPIRP